MPKWILPTLAVACLSIMTAFLTDAPAQTACIDRATAAQTLSDRYQEEPTGAGLHSGGQAVELYVSEDGSTWTIIVIWPDGCAALLATGEAWTPSTPVYDGDQS